MADALCDAEHLIYGCSERTCNGSDDELPDGSIDRLPDGITPPPTRAGKSGGGDSALSEIELKRSFGEYAGLLSEVEGVDEMDFIRTNQQITNASDVDGKDRDEVED